MHPFQLIPNRLRRPVLIAVALVTALTGAWLWMLNRPLQNTAAPGGIYDLELARTPARAQQVVRSWQPVPGFAAASLQPADAIRSHPSLALDGAQFQLLAAFLFIPLYVCALSLPCAWLAEGHPNPALALAAAWSPFLAGLLDAGENTLLLRTLQAGAGFDTTSLVFLIALAKFLLLLLTLAWLGLNLDVRKRHIIAWAPWLVFLEVGGRALAALLRSLA